MRLSDLLNVLTPKTRIRLKIELVKDYLIYEDSLENFKKSRYNRMYFNEPVILNSLSGGFVNGFVLEITVNGVLEDDI